MPYRAAHTSEAVVAAQGYRADVLEHLAQRCGPEHGTWLTERLDVMESIRDKVDEARDLRPTKKLVAGSGGTASTTVRSVRQEGDLTITTVTVTTSHYDTVRTERSGSEAEFSKAHPELQQLEDRWEYVIRQWPALHDVAPAAGAP